MANPSTYLDAVCKRCRKINITNPTPHYNLYDLRRSAYDGCACCFFIYETLPGELFRDNVTIWPDDSPNTLVPLLDRTLIYDFPMERSNLGSRFAFRNHDWLDNGHRLPSFELVMRDEIPVLGGKIKWIPRYLETEPASEAVFNLLTSWLTDCINSHQQCFQSVTVLPHMVLDLRNIDPVLALGNNREERYAALSHCWGKKTLLQTNVQNLFLHLKSVSFSEMPKTFQDAVLVTRRLGIHYLWIDSLCIVQDDFEEWRIESAKMMAYYRDACFTLSALGSSDSHQGFLHSRSTKAQLLLPAESQLYIRKRTDPFQSMFDGEPLNNRAWAFQERLLSTRVIHFGSKELVWDCNTCSAREAGLTDFFSNHLLDLNLPPISGNFGDDSKLLDPSLAASQLLKIPEIDTVMTLNFKRLIIEAAAKNIETISVWEHLVKDFMRRKITRNTDRLPAISGLAKTMFEGTKFTYLAGIVKELPHNLLWKTVMESDAEENVNAQLDAPSWSWAAAKTPISFYKKPDSQTYLCPEYDALITDSEIKTLGPDVFGQVLSGWISLDAYLCALGDVDVVDSVLSTEMRSQRSLLISIQGYSSYGYITMACIAVEPAAKMPNAYQRIKQHRVFEIGVSRNLYKRSCITLI